MFRRSLAALAALFMFTGAQGAEPQPAQPTAARQLASAPKIATPPLFRVSDSDSEFYLLGTFHILPPGLDWRSREAGSALDKAEMLWFEAEVDTPAAQQKTNQVLMTKGFLPAGQTLSKLLSAEDAALLAKIAGETDLPMEAVDPMRPWLAFLTLSVQFIANQGFDPASGVEHILLKESRARGRDMRFLETVEQQLALFTTLSPEAEKELLILTLREWETQREDFPVLFEAWRKGDLETIDALMNEQMRLLAPDVYDMLLVRRNKAWAEEVAAAISGGRGAAVVAVGAGHLAGANSLPQLLADKGFTVERVGGPPSTAENER
jgi:hypothetical protein